MKKIIFCLAAAVVLSMTQTYAQESNEPPAKGGRLPEITLAAPTDPLHRSYLGLSGGAPFKITEIKARVVIIEIFSMYCPYCQREAPLINQLYQAIESRPGLKDRVKLIGLGVGNSSFEVDIFRSTYGIRFPLFPDPDFSIFKSLGKPRTPHFISIMIGDGGGHKVIDSTPGSIENVDSFLNAITKAAGLK